MSNASTAAPAASPAADPAPTTGTTTTEGGDLVAPGPYRARALKDADVAKHFGRSTKKNTMAVTIPFEIVNTARPGQPPSAYSGRTVRYTGYITENTVERLMEGLKHAGAKIKDDYSDLGALNGLGSIECDIDVEIETFEPDPTDEDPNPAPSRRNRVAWINPLGGRVMLESATAADVSALGGLVKGLLDKAKKPGGAPAAGGKGGKGVARDSSGKINY